MSEQNRWFWGIGVVVVLVVLGFLFFGMRDDEQPTPPECPASPVCLQSDGMVVMDRERGGQIVMSLDSWRDAVADGTLQFQDGVTPNSP